MNIPSGIRHLPSIRASGVLLILVSLFALRESFLERWTFISPDHHITSFYFITLITLLKSSILVFGFILVVFPQIVFHTKNLGGYVARCYYKRRMNVTPFCFVLLLCAFIVLYLSLVFISHSLAINKYQQTKNTSPFDVFINFLNVGVYFYKALSAQIFTEAVDYNKIDIPLYKLYIQEEKRNILNTQLPKSGEEYVDGYLVMNDAPLVGNETFCQEPPITDGWHEKQCPASHPIAGVVLEHVRNTSTIDKKDRSRPSPQRGEVFQTYKIKARYRGDTFYHWYFQKKSWRIKLKDHQLINSSNKFNIINPKLDSHLQEMLAYKIAENAGLIVPRNYPVTLSINNQYEGVYYYSDQIDELFFRMHDKVPGDIFYGELYGDTARSGTLFENKSNWDIISTADNNESRALENIDLFIHTVNESDLDFYTFFNQHLGNEYLKFYALTLLLDEYRVDDFHNHKLYFNPTNGMFEPIVWDLMPFMNRNLSLNNDLSNALFSKINLIPPYVEKRNQFLKEYMDKMPEEVLFQYIDNTSALIAYEMEHDIFKDAYGVPWILTYKEWQQSIDTLKEALHNRYSFIRQQLDNSTLTVHFVNNTFLVFDVAGQSGVKIQSLKLAAASDPKRICYTIYKDMNFNLLPEAEEKKQEGCSDDAVEVNVGLLYPGKNDTLRYVYILKTEKLGTLTIGSLNVSNSITGNNVIPHIQYFHSLKELPQVSISLSLHPWEIPVIKNRTMTLEGNIILNEDLILNTGDTLIIKSNTTIRFAPGVSIIAYGKIIAEGTIAEPIQFIPLTNEPWGAVVMQGASSRESFFSYCLLTGGSGAQHNLVHYTGMFSAYNTKVVITNCTFEKNKIEDDAFNAKFSEVAIKDSLFREIFSDAVDFDISNGSIKKTTFVDVKGDAIDLMTSPLLVKDNHIINAGDKGISIGEMSNPTVINNTITASTTAIAIKDRSNPILINNTLISNKIGVALYEKNWRYGGGGFGKIEDTTFCQNAEPILIQNSSQITIEQNGRIIECSEKECPFTCSS